MNVTQQRNLKQFGNLVLIILACLPLLLVVVDVTQNGQNVPYWDQWTSSARVAIKTANGDLTFGDITRQHLEHRIIFTQLVTAIFAYTTNWNVHLEMSANIILALVIFGILFQLYKNFVPAGSPLMIVVFSALVFSIRQRENWLWGFQDCWYFLIMFFLLALLILDEGKPGWRSLISAAISAFCSAFSFGAGILSFPILLVYLWVIGYRRWQYLLFWCAFAMITLGLYFWGYTGGETPTEYNILAIFQYFLAYLGNPFMPFASLIGISILLGFMGIVLFGLNIQYLHAAEFAPKQLAPWVTVAIFSVGSGGLASINRASNGLITALTSRYSTLSSLFWIAFFCVAITVFLHITGEKSRQRGWPRLLANINFVFFILLIVFYLLANYQAATAKPLVTDESKACYLNYSETGDHSCLKEINLVFDPDYESKDTPSEAILVLEALEKAGLTIFAEQDKKE